MYCVFSRGGTSRKISSFEPDRAGHFTSRAEPSRAELDQIFKIEPRTEPSRSKICLVKPSFESSLEAFLDQQILNIKIVPHFSTKPIRLITIWPVLINSIQNDQIWMMFWGSESKKVRLASHFELFIRNRAEPSRAELSSFEPARATPTNHSVPETCSMFLLGSKTVLRSEVRTAFSCTDFGISYFQGLSYNA